MARYRIKEVLNYGGFFGGDTVNAICVPYEGGSEEDITIDEGVFDNLKDRYKVLNGFVVELEREGQRVTHARILGAPTRDQLKEAIDADTPSERAHRYRVFAYRCTAEGLWVRGEPEEVGAGRYRCVLCNEEFSS